MEHLPKVVQSQLKKSPRVSAEPHPDANLLAAFSEKSLTDSERTVVLTHISTCAECRDIVFLSTPEAAAPAVQIRPGSFWRPVFAWGGVAACVLIISGVAVLKHEDQNKKMAAFAKQEAASPVVMQKVPDVQPADQPVPATSTNQVVAQNLAEKDLSKMIKAIPQSKPAAKDSSNEIASYGTAMRAMPRDANRPTPNTAQAPAAATAEQDKVEAYSSPNVQLSGTNPAAPQAIGGIQRVNAEAAPQSSPAEMKETFADTGNTTGIAAGRIKFDRSPRWTLNSDGTLLRSVDTGTSWKKILIPGNAATLRTIATVGPDVWVGGTEGAVYHSNDAGGHWMPISLTEDGKPLSDDVISIKFASPQQGAILTDHQAVWTTNDGGLTWYKK